MRRAHRTGFLGRPGLVAVVAVLAVVGVLAVVPTDAAEGRGWRRGWQRPSGTPLVCGELPTVDVVLVGDLTCPTGFHFGPGDVPVSIDLRGYTLTVPGDAGVCAGPGPCGAVAGAEAVRNGTVVGTLSDVGETSAVVVHGDVELAFGASRPGAPSSLRHSMVLDGTVRVWGSSVSISGNVIRGGISLVSSFRSIRDLVVTGNWVVESPRSGIEVAPPFGNFPGDVDGRIAHNIVWGSAGAGIDVGRGVWNIGSLAVEANLLVANGASGFRSGTSESGPGILVGGPVTVTANVAMLNRGHGFEAGWMAGVDGSGIVDGGANQAAFNAVEPACIGIAC